MPFIEERGQAYVDKLVPAHRATHSVVLRQSPASQAVGMIFGSRPAAPIALNYERELLEWGHKSGQKEQGDAHA